LSLWLLLACNLEGWLGPDNEPAAGPLPTETATLPPPTTPPQTEIPAPPATPIDTEALIRQALDQAELNNVALIDEAGLDFAEKRTIDVYRRVAPAVVNITTQVLQRSFFFEVIPAEGAGSGFVIDRDGTILTNYHVIEDARAIEVTFIDESTVPAKLIGGDPRNDVAVLRVETLPAGVQPAELGNSAGLHVGQRAIAIGNPFGQFGSTMTTGVVSALNRTIQGQDGREISSIIQTDAAINQGNSGGPLLDSAGRVIGINTAIFSPSGTNAGVGFAVPVDTLRRVLPDLLELGYYRHPWLGIRYAYKITPGLSELLNLPVDQGLLLVELWEIGPLAQNDVRGAQEEVIYGNQRVFIGGDILVALNGQVVTSLEQLDLLLADYRVGDPVEVTIIREGQERTVNLNLGEEPVAR
jgi:putative serine protease PepD